MIFCLVFSLCISEPSVQLSTPFFSEADTLKKTIVSDENWLESSHVDYVTCNKFPWIGISNPPADSTFVEIAQVGQPHGFPTVGVLPNASVISSNTGVHFFKSSFTLDSGTAVTDCRLRAFVDDDIEIYINGNSVVRENSGVPENRGGVPHDILFFDFGTFINPYNGGDPFDLVTFDPIANFFVHGKNEVTVAVRNKLNDKGGFSFRMDLNYVLNPDWVSNNEYSSKSDVFNIYPNPANEILEIVYANPRENKTIEVTLVNVNGAIVLQQNLSKLESQTLDISILNPGIYIIQLKDGSSTYHKKLMKI